MSTYRGVQGVALGFGLLFLVSACAPENFDQLKAVSGDALETMLVEEQFDAWSAFYQPGAELNGSQLAATVMQGYARGLHYAFPDLSLRIVEQIGAPDRVVTHFVIDGTHQGAFSALPPTNKAVELEGVAIDHFQDGLIVRTRLMLDISRLTNSLAGAGGASR